MQATEPQLVSVNACLRLALFALECVLDVEFASDVVEQIFLDAQSDSRSEKRYTLWLGPGLKVTARADDYEPEDIRLTVEARKPFTPSLYSILERAKYQAYRLEQWQEAQSPWLRPLKPAR